MRVTAIMPTRGRREWAAQALRSFFSQSHSDKQIIIADDDDDPSFDPFPKDPDGLDRINYLRIGHRRSIPLKRNLCCELASSDIIMHWDSDDWSARHRMADQAVRLENSGLAVGGYYSMLFWDHQSRLGYRYRGAANYAVGTSLAYRRDWWEGHRFPENIQLGEDNEFVRIARNHGQIHSADSGALMVARIHADNSCAKNRSGGSEYQKFPTSHFPREFFF